MAKIPFNVDAYTAKLIGRENVSKLDGAILELVKNTYDADASICLLYYEKTTDTLFLADNGTGMTEGVILKHWMTIGSSSKKTQFKTKKGRIQTGAKGIGRFALDRIADNCTLLTISKDEHLIWNVDWSSFEFGQRITDITADLDKSNLSFTQFLSNIINKDVLKVVQNYFLGTGSFFKLTNLRDSWNKSTITSLTSNLKTLIPPEFKEIFNIYFFEEDTSAEDAALLQDGDDFSYDYRINFSAFTNGKVRIKIHRNEFDFGSDFDKITSEAGFNSIEKGYFKNIPLVIDTTFTDVLRSKSPIENTIGDFKGTLYFAKLAMSKSDRQKYYYKDISGRHDIRDSFGGIRIYRDGFRVRPYGDPKSTSFDWLMLSARKNKSPASISHPTGSWRVNGDQIHGSIYISRTNTALHDQANRQGIVETREFLLLQEFLQNVIRYFERDRQAVCRTLLTYFEKTHPTSDIKKELEAKLKKDAQKKDSFKHFLEEISKTHSSSEENQYQELLKQYQYYFKPYIEAPNQYQELLKQCINAGGVSSLLKNNQDLFEKYLKQTLFSEYIEVTKASALLEEKNKEIEQLETELKLLRVLATTGIVTNTYIHEIKEITHKLGMKITMAKESLEFDKDPNEAYEYLLEANTLKNFFTSWFKVTVDSVKRDKRTMRNTDVNELVSNLLSDWQTALEPKKITISSSIDNITCKCFPYEIESIFNNLIANSAASFDTFRSETKNISITIESTKDGLMINYSDNGIGLSGEYKRNPYLILESFESDKRSANGEIIGTGMGMWIINRIVNEYGGSIDLSKNISHPSGFFITLFLKLKS